MLNSLVKLKTNFERRICTNLFKTVANIFVEVLT